MSVTIDVDLWAHVNLHRIGVPFGWATGPPAVPHIVSLCTVMDQDEKPQGHTEGSIKTAKYHIQEMTLRYCKCSEGPSGSKQEQSECCGSKLSLK